jgi:hypothetical protein
MLKHHPIISAVLSIAFVIAVQLFASPQPVFRFMLPAFFLYLGVVTLYNRYYLLKTGQYNHWALVRPALFLICWFGVYLIIPSEFWRGAYLLVGVVVIYLVERLLGNAGEQLLFNQTFITAFAGFMTLTGLSHYFLLPGTLYLFIVFLFVALLSRAAYDFVPESQRIKWVTAFIISLVVTEVFWAFSFLPLHYSALGLLTFNVFYCLWILCYYYLYNHLTTKKVQFQLFLAVLFTIIILAVTPWSILA